MSGLTSAPMNIAQAKDTVDLSIQKMYKKSSEPESMYTKYFNYRTTEDYYDKDSGLSGLGEADFVSENSTIFADDPVQTYKQTYTQNMVGMIIPFTFQMSIVHHLAVMLRSKLCKFGGSLFEAIPSQALVPGKV